MVKKSKILAILLAFAVVVTFMPFTTLTVEAASKGKVKMVTQVTSDDGSVVKYSYNKKGLVSKIVSTKSERGSADDSYRTVTTTFNYNKKNRITTKVTKSVYQNIEYKMDKTTGKKILGTESNIITTTTTVENFAYNSKGLATQSVRTSTVVKSGREVYEDESTTYKDNGNGTYTETYVEKGEDPSVYVRSNKTVTTTKYSYDKKKRVIRADVNEVESYSSTNNYTSGGTAYAYTYERSSENSKEVTITITSIPDEYVPTSSTITVNIDEPTTIPGTPVIITIEEEDVPLAGAPKTGENNIPFMIFGSAFTMVVVAGITYFFSKKSEEE